MGKAPVVSAVTTSSRRLGAKSLVGTSGLVLVGGGLVAWQAFRSASEEGVCLGGGGGGKAISRRPFSVATTTKNRRESSSAVVPEFVALSPSATERLMLAPPDLLDAREDLRSIVLPKHLRRPWKLLRQANWCAS